MLENLIKFFEVYLKKKTLGLSYKRTLSAFDSDNANFVNSDNPWFIRGGNATNTTNAGVFNFNRNNGNANDNISARVDYWTIL